MGLRDTVRLQVKRHLQLYIMSTDLPTRQTSLHEEVALTIVSATYNEKFTTALLQNCLDELAESAPYFKVDIVRVPGAYEVPVMVKRTIVKSKSTPNIVIALGVILRGSTAHANLIGESITRELMRIACDSLVPVIHEVLLLDDEDQAFTRCVASRLNRGREAARAAIAMINAMREQDVHLEMINTIVPRSGRDPLL